VATSSSTIGTTRAFRISAPTFTTTSRRIASSLAFTPTCRKSVYQVLANRSAAQKHQLRYLNRFLFDPEDVEHEQPILGEEAPKRSPFVILPKDDYRTIHAAKILGLHNGDTVRAGVVSSASSTGPNANANPQEPHHDNRQEGLLTDTAVIEWIPEGKVKKAEPLANGQPPGSLCIRLDDLQPPSASQRQESASVALLLALPRPLQLGRMLPMIAQMGVSHLILTGAHKVPRDYFGSHLFRYPQKLRASLIEGLCQAGDVQLPQLHIVKNLQHFLEDDLDDLFPVTEYARVVAHPQRTTVAAADGSPTTSIPPIRMRNVEFPSASQKKLLLAVGPEGGWDEPDELDRFESYKFQQVTLGQRILRSDTAVVSLLALAHDACVATDDDDDDESTNHPH